MNKWFGDGNICQDIKVETTSGGIKYTRFQIGVRAKAKKPDGTNDTYFINCIAWRTLAEHLEKYFKKGDGIIVCGELQVRAYEKDGVKKYATEINVDEVDFKGKKGKEPELTPIPDESLPF